MHYLYNMNTPLIGMTLDELHEVCNICKLPRFAAKQIARWLYVNRATSIDQFSDISLRGREELQKQGYCVGFEPPKFVVESSDGTKKYLFTGAGGRDIEAVMIPDRDRATLCVSSQAGCRMNCAFCMTGRQGFHGNLTAAQIINQVLSVHESQNLTNLVFMGMGEPMDNLSEVLRAIEILTAPWGFAWSPKRITVSTIGKLAELRRLIDETKVHIAISVHSPFSEQRASLMPVEKAYPIASVLSELRQFNWAGQRRLSIEYIMWKNLNADLHHADALARLLQGTACRVNLIRFHAIPDSNLLPASQNEMIAFRDRLNQKGITATIRASRGEDIMAACGMLAGKQNKNQ